MNFFASVTGAWSAFATKVGAFLPDLLWALIILIVGWLICKIARRIVSRVLKLCQFDILAARSGVSRALSRGGIQLTPADIVSLLIFWFLFLIVIVAALETLHLPEVTETLKAVFLYIPKVVAAIVVLILGLYLANLLETITRASCANAKLQQADSLGRVAYYATVVFVVAAILQLLQIAADIVKWAFVSVFGAVCLALALAFGLGGREVASRHLDRWLEKKGRRK